jgi:hypothetical protein
MKEKETQDWKIREVPIDLARRLKAAIAAEGLNGRTWWIQAAEKTISVYEARMAKGGKS